MNNALALISRILTNTLNDKRAIEEIKVVINKELIKQHKLFEATTKKIGLTRGIKS